MKINAYKAVIKAEKQKEVEEYLVLCERDIQKRYYETGKVMSVNVFGFEMELYIYIESCDETVYPEQLFPELENMICEWPDGSGKYFYSMLDIFHFNQPQSIEHWERKKRPDYCFAMIARLIPEMTARYIFYHYQFQEETPGMGDKYGRIFLMGDVALYYGEVPEIEEPPVHKGTLSTRNTPVGDEWQSLMGTHFVWWNDSYPSAEEVEFFKFGYPENCRNNQWLYIKNILSIV